MTVAYPAEGFRRSTAARTGPILLPARAEPIGLGYPVSYPVSRRVDQFTEFEDYSVPNWDGYDAEPITPETLRAARSVWTMLSMDTPMPDVAPGGDGTIGFAWRSGSLGNRTHRVIVVGPGSDVSGYWIHPDGRLEKLPVTNTITGARRLIGQLLA
jgi:hypothetical protein